jgi:hypothetical protein
LYIETAIFCPQRKNFLQNSKTSNSPVGMLFHLLLNTFKY